MSARFRAMKNNHRLATVVAGVLLAVVGCEKKKSASGLAPATNWSANAANGSAAPTAPPTAMSNPHGVDPAGADPHAPMNGGPAGGDPHAGMNMGGSDVTAMGLPSPDPDRPVNPNNILAGTIEAGPGMADKLKSGTAIFLVAKAAGPDGVPMGPPLAVEKLIWNGTSLPFKLSEANAMIAGTVLSGDVVLVARYDQDGEALSKKPGDVTATLKAKVPSTTLKLSLDTLLP